jgi:pimeloyl-ACP methyl ester carboxylesterase
MMTMLKLPVALCVATLGCFAATPDESERPQLGGDELYIRTSATRAESNRTRKIVRYGNVRVDVIAEGKGPLIVMLPSSGRDSEDFDEAAAGIAAAGFRVLRPQPRGMGRSAGPMQNLTYHDLARDVAAVIEQQAQGPAVIVGHAFGNQIARMTAVDHPNLVRGVVLAAAAAKGPSPQPLGQALRRASDPSLPDRERLQALQLAFFAPGHDPSRWLCGWHPVAMRAQQGAIASTRQEEWWSAGTAPILDLQAGLDPWRPRSSQDELKSELGDRVTVAVIPNASHALVVEQPAAVVREIVAWVRRR